MAQQSQFNIDLVLSRTNHSERHLVYNRSYGYCYTNSSWSNHRSSCSKKVGKKSPILWWFCGWFPDIDVLFHSLQSWDGLVEHRGMTHSVLILPFASPILGGIAYKLDELYPPKRPRKKKAREQLQTHNTC